MKIHVSRIRWNIILIPIVLISINHVSIQCSGVQNITNQTVDIQTNNPANRSARFYDVSSPMGQRRPTKQVNSSGRSLNELPGESPVVTRKFPGIKCSQKSMVLSRHILANEFKYINRFTQIWFNDLDENELLDKQKQSLSNIVMADSGSQLLNSDGLPLIEFETSYFRPLNLDHLSPILDSINHANNTHFTRLVQRKQQQPTARTLPISIEMMRHHPNQRCYMVDDSSSKRFVLVFGVAVGPIEHLMDVVYNIPNKLRLSQPIEWHRAQVRLIVPQMNYEIVLHQATSGAEHKLISGVTGKCPIRVAEITYIGPHAAKQGTFNSPVLVSAPGLAINNQTVMQLERIFDDYTRPAITSRLSQMFEFYLNSKLLPLNTAV